MRTFLLGLGGSGIAVVTRLKKDLQSKLEAVEGAQRVALEKQFDQVSCVVMDTDQREKKNCTSNGIESIFLSGDGNVGSYLQALEIADDDVLNWCPYSGEDAAFLNEPLDDGASQCRMKSRLCLGVFLKNEKNDLAKLFDYINAVSGDLHEQTLRFMVISSIAGGTGSGIFIQVALYIKKYFREKYNASVKVYGLFACPDLFSEKVPAAQLESIYANAYAAVRELNAINIVYGNAATNEYGRNIKIKISSKAEGRLFTPNEEGLFGQRPFDQLYFIDDVNAYGGRISNLEEYFDVMANFVYTRMFSPISGALMTAESNEMDAHSRVKLAIYGSAGNATMKYPYQNIVSYLAARFLNDSVSDLWTVFDKEWREFVRIKEQREHNKGNMNYRPTAEERAEYYIGKYNQTVYNETEEAKNKRFAFLRNALDFDESTQTPYKVSKYMALLEKEALNLVQNDSTLKKSKEDKAITPDKIRSQCEYMESRLSKKNGSFGKIKTIDDGIATYISECCSKIEDLATDFSVSILCNEPNLWNDSEKISFNIVQGLLSSNDENKVMVHPLTVRYLLYCFKKAVDKKLTQIIGDDSTSPKMTLKLFKERLNEKSKYQDMILDSNSDDGIDEKTVDVLKKDLKHLFGGVAKAQMSLNEYKDNTIGNIRSIEKYTSKAILFFALKEVYEKLAQLISNYELFFDRIDEYRNSLTRDVMRLEADRNAPGKTTYYVGASPASKKELYESISTKLDPDSGDAAAAISRSFFETVRDNLWNSEKYSSNDDIHGMEAFFRSIRYNLEKHIKEDTYIRNLIDIDVFTALMNDYVAENGADALEKIDPNGHKTSSLSAYLKKQFSELIVRSAPMLNYDPINAYASFNTRDKEAQERIRVSQPHAFLEMNPGVAKAIKDRLFYNAKDEEEAVGMLISECSNARGIRLPSFEEKNIAYVKNEWRTTREIFMVSSVHCLQPYQISKFDELNNGDYYKNYRSRIDSILESGILSRSPHLDKNWHKHGMMPYINISKELESRYSLAKAFVYALLFSTIKCSVDKNEIYYHFYDPDFVDSSERICYKGMPVKNRDLAKILYWLMDREDIVRQYAAFFDEYLENEELEMATRFTGDVRNYEALVTNNRLVHYLREDLIGVGYAKNQFTAQGKKLITVPPIGILKVAAYVRNSEEKMIDYDYAEVIINVAEEVIYRFSRAPFSDVQLKSEQSNDQKDAFRKILEWNKLKFMESYCNQEMESRKLEKKETEENKIETTELDCEPSESEPLDSSPRLDSRRFQKASTKKETDIQRLIGRNIPAVIADSDDFKWLDSEFQIDPNMNIERPGFED